VITSRREILIGTGGALAAGAFLFSDPSLLFANPLGRSIGLQLYTIGEQLQKDYYGTLEQVAAIGYREVEMAGFFGKKPAEIKTSFRNAGLHCGSLHIGMGGVEEALRYATEIGAKYIISSVVLPAPLGPGTGDAKTFRAKLDSLTFDDYKSIAEKCNDMGEVARKAGVQFGYHNHNLEFKPLEGGIGYDELIRATDPRLVKFELDCGWMAVAGYDPAEYLARYPTRYRLLHIKEFQPTIKPVVTLDGNSRLTPTELGRGHVDYPTIFAAAKKTEVEWYYVEQEPPFTTVPAMEAIKIDYDYLHRLN